MCVYDMHVFVLFYCYSDHYFSAGNKDKHFDFAGPFLITERHVSHTSLTEALDNSWVRPVTFSSLSRSDVLLLRSSTAGLECLQLSEV